MPYQPVPESTKQVLHAVAEALPFSEEGKRNWVKLYEHLLSIPDKQ